MFSSIKNKVLASQLVLAFLAMLTLGLVSYFLMVEHLNLCQREKLRYIAQAKAEEIQGYLNANKALLERATNSREFEDFHITFRGLPLIKHFAKFTQVLPVMAYVNKAGEEELKVVKAKASEQTLTNLSQDPAFQDSLRQPNQVIISPVEPNPELAEPTIRFLLSKYSYFGDEFIGTLVATIPLSKINALLNAEIGESSFISLINHNGLILSSPQKDRILTPISGKGKAAEKLISDAKQLKTGFSRANILGLDGFVAYAPVKEMRWSVLVTLPYQEFMVAPNNLKKAAAGIFLLLLILTLIVSLTLTRGITNPLLKLTAAVNSITKGNFSERVEVRSEDEIGQLACAFNAMTENLEQTTVSRDELAKEVSERRKAEEELWESQERYRALTENSLFGIAVLDTNYKIMMVNSTFARLFKKSPADFAGKYCFREFEKREAVCAHCPGTRAMVSGKTEEVETQGVRDDGSRFYVHNRAVPFFGRDGVLKGFIEMVEDIDERKRMEEALRQNENYLKTIFNSVQAGVIIVDAETHRIVDANPVAVKLFGAPREQIVNALCYKFICPAEEGKCPITDLHQEVDNSERVLVKANGERLPVLKTVVSITLRNHKFLLESFVDITERKKAEEELKKAYTRLKEMQDQLIQAEKLNAVGQLASGIAHEVRNPLGIILQGVNYLEKKISTKEEDAFETLTILKDSVKKADKIINALLDFSKATRLDLQPEDANSILEVSLNLLKAKFKFENIDIVLETKKDIPRVLADKNKLEQVFINILLNAVQAMPEGGKIIIRSYDKQLEEVKNGIGRRGEDHFEIGEEAVIVEIEDTGIGIPEENLKKIFDPFFTTKAPTAGVGLGLSVSRNIIHMHKGLIYAESQVGKGTKMTIILKIAKR